MSTENKLHKPFVAEDLARVAGPLDLSGLDGARVVITGASGFVGIWLTELLAYLASLHKLDLKLTLVARDFGFARREAPHLFAPGSGFDLVTEDVRSLHELPQDTQWIVHAAGSPDVRSHNSQPIFASQTITQGTLTVLECASRLPGLKGLLNLSSGWVYGHPASGPASADKFEGFDPAVFSAGYAEAKRYAESLCTLFRNQFRLPVINVRPFSFVGPYQSVDAPWAVNNFIQDVVHRRPIRIQGDGSAVRSYMYGADMAWWLLVMLLKGGSGKSYNLGSTDALTLEQLAGRLVKLSMEKVQVNLAPAMLKSKPSIFVPSLGEEETKLGLKLKFDLDLALSRTLQWYSLKGAEVEGKI